jgi:hypothetical protein
LGAQSKPLIVIVVSYLPKKKKKKKKKHRLGPQNGPKGLGPEKLLKIVNCQQTVLIQLE